MQMQNSVVRGKYRGLRQIPTPGRYARLRRICKVLYLLLSRQRIGNAKKIVRALKLGLKEQEHVRATSRSIGTARKQLTDLPCGKFDRLVQRSWEVMFIHKKAYILWQLCQLLSKQKRCYLELKGDDDVPNFQIPDNDLKEIGSKPDVAFVVIIVMRPIDHTSYARFDNLTEGIPVVLGAQNDALAIANRITPETITAEASGEEDIDACASVEGVMLDSGVSYYLSYRPKHLTARTTGFIGRRGSEAGENIGEVRPEKDKPSGGVGIRTTGHRFRGSKFDIQEKVRQEGVSTNSCCVVNVRTEAKKGSRTPRRSLFRTHSQ